MADPLGAASFGGFALPARKRFGNAQRSRLRVMGRLLSVTESADLLPPWANRERAFVELWSFRCEACRAVAPGVARLAIQSSNDVDVFKVNIDDCPRYASQLGITIPALVEMRDGGVHRSWLGTWTLEEVHQGLASDDLSKQSSNAWASMLPKCVLIRGASNDSLRPDVRKPRCTSSIVR